MRELASIFIFWMILVTPALAFAGELYYYPNKEVCEAALELNRVGNSHIVGLAIAPECIEIPVPPKKTEGLPV